MIQLKGNVDPQVVLAAVNNFFGSAAAAEGEPELRVDADPLTGRIFIRGPETLIAEVKLLIEKLEGPSEQGSGSTMRFIPFGGGNPSEAVDMVQRLWTESNKIQFVTPSESSTPSLFNLREIHPSQQLPPLEQLEPQADPNLPAPPPAARPAPAPGPSTSLEKQPSTVPAAHPEDKFTRHVRAAGGVPVQFVSFHPDEQQDGELEEEQQGAPAAATPTQDTPVPAAKPAPAAPQAANPGADIRVEVTPNGILIASEDTVALDKFETMLRQVLGPVSGGPSTKGFTVYFLKYCRAEVAQQLISNILGGTTSDAGGGSLIGDMASNLMGGGGGILGALLGGSSGGSGAAVTTVQGTGTVSLVADARLNCLIVQGMPVDVQLIEQLLKVIDREDSITDIETAGTPHIIPIQFMPAENVANVVREAYADRMQQSNQRGGGGQPNPADLIRACAAVGVAVAPRCAAKLPR